MSPIISRIGLLLFGLLMLAMIAVCAHAAIGAARLGDAWGTITFVLGALFFLVAPVLADDDR